MVSVYDSKNKETAAAVKKEDSTSARKAGTGNP